MNDKALTKYRQVTGACARFIERQQRNELTEDEAQTLINDSKANRSESDWQAIKDFQDECRRTVYKCIKKGLIQPASDYAISHPTLWNIDTR